MKSYSTKKEVQLNNGDIYKRLCAIEEHLGLNKPKAKNTCKHKWRAVNYYDSHYPDFYQCELCGEKRDS